jgi:hypothetical protein
MDEREFAAKRTAVAALVVRVVDFQDPICAPHDGMPATETQHAPPHHAACQCVIVRDRAPGAERTGADL